jgi:hypothetical protein
MIIFHGFLLKILKSVSYSKKMSPKMSIIVRQPYAYLETDLQKIFKVQEDVEVVVDRRYGQQRTEMRDFPHERRRSDRRKSKETLIKVVIST